MKPILKILTVAFILVSTTALQAKAQPHSNNGGNAPTSDANTPVGAGAPVGSGTLLLFGLAGLYAGYKTMELHSKKVEHQL